jgi:hypothetical protein
LKLQITAYAQLTKLSRNIRNTSLLNKLQKQEKRCTLLYQIGQKMQNNRLELRVGFGRWKGFCLYLR